MNDLHVVDKGSALDQSLHQCLRFGATRFASTRLKGKQPRVANMLVEDHLRPAAVKAGVLKEGEKVRFGFHNLRHSLASFLVRKGTDVKTVQKMLRTATFPPRWEFTRTA